MVIGPAHGALSGQAVGRTTYCGALNRSTPTRIKKWIALIRGIETESCAKDLSRAVAEGLVGSYVQPWQPAFVVRDGQGATWVPCSDSVRRSRQYGRMSVRRRATVRRTAANG